MYVGLSEALPPTKDCNDRTIEFQNKLGPGKILGYSCDWATRPTNVPKWSCFLRAKGLYYPLIVELSPPTPPCNNGLRSWIVKSDGIYFERNGKKPMKLVGRWKSGPY
ncbi:hypothetical protein IGI04_032138 [Brassica rapa subsp. trilocularis]|uniref:S-protein homolog n=1 Tax=Brassica rapa subsp. trilocularis TaxID=1813537 RepID=A0ABQ7LWE8_BRACM|nr:hypothetical protein IGI04_032138 [Brassica rapa subsp. trilocularis]